MIVIEDTTDLEIDIATLQAIINKRHSEYRTNIGLCSNMMVVNISLYAEDWPENTREEWDEESGRYTYIIPHPELTGGAAYGTLFVDGFYSDTPYGDARRRLAQHVLDKLLAKDKA